MYNNLKHYMIIDSFDSRDDFYRGKDEASEIWFRVSKLPDLTLTKYSSLEETGVSGVLGRWTVNKCN